MKKPIKIERQNEYLKRKIKKLQTAMDYLKYENSVLNEELQTQREVANKDIDTLRKEIAVHKENELRLLHLTNESQGTSRLARFKRFFSIQK